MPSQLICNVCNEHIAKSKYKIGCTGCVNFFHLDCVGVSEAEARVNKALRYTCSACVRSAGGDGASGVVDRGILINSVPNLSPAACASVVDDVAAGSSDAVRRWQDDLLLTMKKQMDIYMDQCVREFKAKADALFELYSVQISEVKSSLNSRFGIV